MQATHTLDLDSPQPGVQVGLQALDQGEYDEYAEPGQLAAEVKARGRQRLKNFAKDPKALFE